MDVPEYERLNTSPPALLMTHIEWTVILRLAEGVWWGECSSLLSLKSTVSRLGAIAS
jgi:hypothetical protein